MEWNKGRLLAGQKRLLEPGQRSYHVKTQLQIIHIGRAQGNGGGEGQDGAFERQAGAELERAAGIVWRCLETEFLGTVPGVVINQFTAFEGNAKEPYFFGKQVSNGDRGGGISKVKIEFQHLSLFLLIGVFDLAQFEVPGPDVFGDAYQKVYTHGGVVTAPVPEHR